MASDYTTAMPSTSGSGARAVLQMNRSRQPISAAAPASISSMRGSRVFGAGAEPDGGVPALPLGASVRVPARSDEPAGPARPLWLGEGVTPLPANTPAHVAVGGGIGLLRSRREPPALNKVNNPLGSLSAQNDIFMQTVPRDSFAARGGVSRTLGEISDSSAAALISPIDYNSGAAGGGLMLKPLIKPHGRRSSQAPPTLADPQAALRARAEPSEEMGPARSNFFMTTPARRASSTLNPAALLKPALVL